MSETAFATALDSLGEILPVDPGRDAVHLATFAVIAGERLFPGQHIGLMDGNTAGSGAAPLLGIVDPFLTTTVFPGQMFWMMLYPRTITSLRHVWTHPAFTAETVKAANIIAPAVVDEREESRLWLVDFADRLFSYEPEYASKFDTLMSGAEGGGFGSDIEYGDNRIPSDEFWKHYERYVGHKVTDRPERFSCSC
jgi:hypothetical protein